ncbi:MAG: hypothetical protein QOD84_2470, partial [Acidobacteriaceae bacterium]
MLTRRNRNVTRSGNFYFAVNLIFLTI